MKKRLPALALLLALLLGQAGCGRPPQPSPSPSPSPAAPPPVLALFTTSHDPWCAVVAEAGRTWASERGWRVVEYDCAGVGTTRTLQVEDFLRGERAELAVVYGLEGTKALAAQTQALSEGGVPVLAVSREYDPGSIPRAVCAIGPDREALAQAALDYFRPLAADGVLLLPDSQDDPREGAVADAFWGGSVPILELAYTWGGTEFARDYLLDALPRFPGAAGAVCFSRVGTAGARAALGALDGERDFRILCLDCSAQLLADLESGAVDALLAVSAQEAGELLTAALDQAARGEEPGTKALTVELLTADTAGQDMGYR